MKRFNIATPVLFAPPNPSKVAGAAVMAPMVPSFASFFGAYFGNSSYNLGDSKCGKVLENMKRCYENNQENAHSACSFYVDGFRRMACSKL